MKKDLWLPQGFDLPEGMKIKSLVYDGTYYQIYALTRQENRALLASVDLARSWIDCGLWSDDVLQRLSFGPADFLYLTSDRRILAPVFACPNPGDFNEAPSVSI